jgi:CPA2 family monovalent cation:H+ antiporter-2
VRHEGRRSSSPAPDLCLSEGDVLVLYGVPEDLEHAETILLKG